MVSTDAAANPEADFLTFSGSALYFGIIAAKEIAKGDGSHEERDVGEREEELQKPSVVVRVRT